MPGDGRKAREARERLPADFRRRSGHPVEGDDCAPFGGLVAEERVGLSSPGYGPGDLPLSYSAGGYSVW